MADIIVAFSLLLLPTTIILYHRTVHLVLREAGPRNRTLKPWLVWPSLLPYFGFFWNLFVVWQTARTIRNCRTTRSHSGQAGGVLLLGLMASPFIGLATTTPWGPGILLFGSPIQLAYWIVLARQRPLLWRLDDTGSNSAPERRTDADRWFATPPIHNNSSLDNPRSETLKTTSMSLLFYGSLIILASMAALSVANWMDLYIWERSGLWTEPTDRISRFRWNAVVYSAMFLIMLPITILVWMRASRQGVFCHSHFVGSGSGGVWIGTCSLVSSIAVEGQYATRPGTIVEPNTRLRELASVSVAPGPPGHCRVRRIAILAGSSLETKRRSRSSPHRYLGIQREYRVGDSRDDLSSPT